MVRKRTRSAKTRRNSKKTYESDDNDSDVDLNLDSPSSSPAPKRYGLRQRKQPVFFNDFDYDDDEDFSSQKPGSDDEEYDVEVDLHTAVNNQVVGLDRNQIMYGSPRETSSVYNTEPENEEIPTENGLIDFEDVIRADVVNKQRVDYDNMINKTEIQVQVRDPPSPVKEKGRRGRKPRIRPELITCDNIIKLVPIEERNPVKNSLEDPTNVEVQIDPSSLVQSDSDENDSIVQTNGDISEDTIDEYLEEDNKDEELDQNATKLQKPWAEKIEKYVPPELDEKEKEVVLSNEYLLANTFDITADEFLQKQEEKKDVEEEQEEEQMEELPDMLFDDEYDDDDDDDNNTIEDDSSNDVVIIEKKPEIIILDDD